MIGLQIEGREDALYMLDLNETVGDLLVRIENTENEQGRVPKEMVLNFGKWDSSPVILRDGRQG